MNYPFSGDSSSKSSSAYEWSSLFDLSVSATEFVSVLSPELERVDVVEKVD